MEIKARHPRFSTHLGEKRFHRDRIRVKKEGKPNMVGGSGISKKRGGERQRRALNAQERGEEG